jgi:hypothetical protein
VKPVQRRSGAAPSALPGAIPCELPAAAGYELPAGVLGTVVAVPTISGRPSCPGVGVGTETGTDGATEWTAEIRGGRKGPIGLAPRVCALLSTTPPTIVTAPDARGLGESNGALSGIESVGATAVLPPPAAAAVPAKRTEVDLAAVVDRHSTGLVRRTFEDPFPLRSVIRLALAGPVTLRPHLAVGLPFRLLARADSASARLDDSVDTSITAAMRLSSRSCALFDARHEVIVQIVCRLSLRLENCQRKGNRDDHRAGLARSAGQILTKQNPNLSIDLDLSLQPIGGCSLTLLMEGALSSRRPLCGRSVPNFEGRGIERHGLVVGVPRTCSIIHITLRHRRQRFPEPVLPDAYGFRHRIAACTIKPILSLMPFPGCIGCLNRSPRTYAH